MSSSERAHVSWVHLDSGKVKSLVDLSVAVRGELFPECLREVEDDGEGK